MARVSIYESEVRTIAREAFSWDTETGGDLFGLWDPEPTIVLATIAGPNAQRSPTRCRFDLAYVEQVSLMLNSDWGLQYFGDWHSHPLHRTICPSERDRERLRQVAARNGFARMIECIVLPFWFADRRPEMIHLHVYHYDTASWESPQEMQLRVLPGISRIRTALQARGELPEQKLADYELTSREWIPCLQDVELAE